MKILLYSKLDKKIIEDIKNEDLPSYINNNNYIIWIDIENPSRENMLFLLDSFGFHPLDIEDCISIIENKYDKEKKHENEKNSGHTNGNYSGEWNRRMRYGKQGNGALHTHYNHWQRTD